jgi:hypothetical protein
VTRHYILRYTAPISSVMLVTRSVSTSLLTPSRQVHSECFAALSAKMRELANSPYLYYIDDSRQLVEFASRPSHYIYATENTARQQGCSIESQVTVVAAVPEPSKKPFRNPAYGQTPKVFIIKCAFLTALYSPSTLRVFVRAD